MWTFVLLLLWHCAAQDKRDLNERTSFIPLASNLDEMRPVYHFAISRCSWTSLDLVRFHDQGGLDEIANWHSYVSRSWLLGDTHHRKFEWRRVSYASSDLRADTTLIFL